MAPIGVDEWVAQSGDRREQHGGWRGGLARVDARLGWWPRLLLVGVAAFVYGQFIANGNINFAQTGFNVVLYALLALGLNIVVGWAGLLDLGYIAFFGAGAYGYALFSSHAFGNLAAGTGGIMLPAIASIPIAVVGVGVLGLLIGLVALRLSGDYLAIVTLFVGQAFAEAVNSVAPSTLGGAERPVRTQQLPGRQRDDRLDDRLLLVRGDRAARADGAAAPARHLAHRPGVAGGARRPARGRGDVDPGQSRQGDGVHLRRGRRGARGHDLRRPAEQCVLDELQRAGTDPDLRLPGPRRGGQHLGSGTRRRRGDRRATAADQSAGLGLPVLRRARARAGHAHPPLAPSRGRGGRDRCLRPGGSGDRRRDLGAGRRRLAGQRRLVRARAEALRDRPGRVASDLRQRALHRGDRDAGGRRPAEGRAAPDRRGSDRLRRHVLLGGETDARPGRSRRRS